MDLYVGIASEQGGKWRIRLFDFPAAVGEGQTAEDAMMAAMDAFWVHLGTSRRQARALSLPQPTPMAAVLRSGALRPGEAPLLVPLGVGRGRVVRVTISMESDLLDAVDLASTAEGLGVSAWLGVAARQRLAERR